MEIDFLANRTEYLHDVANMIYEEFVLKTSSKKTLEDVITYFSKTSCNQFPVTFIALEENECIGTVSIFENDLKEREMYKPWLASLYTKPAHRRKGVGEKLILETLQIVKDLEYQELYLKTETAANYYRNKGWTFVEAIVDHSGEEVDIFKFVL